MRDPFKHLDWRLLAALLLSGLLFFLLIRHTPGLNGPAYWKWPWRRLDPIQAYLPLLLAALPFAGAQWLQHVRGRHLLVPLLLLMAANLALQLVAVGSQSHPFSLSRIARIVEDPTITSYYTDAGGFTGLREWLGDFPERMRSFHLHSVNKPPGPVLYWVLMLRLFGESAAQAGGLIVGVLATAAIPATFLMIRALGGPRDAAFAGASFLSLCPGPVLFFPEFDQLYAPLVCVLVVLWIAALERHDRRCAVGFGAALFVLTFFSFALLVMGLFLALVAFLFWLEAPRERWRGVVVAALLGVAVVVAAYLLLWLATGYDPWSTFVTARRHQAQLAQLLQRPYPQTILFDLTDFALGTGWIGVLLAGLFFARREARDRRALLLGLCCVAQIVFVGAAGLIPTETARVWIFMMPLLMFPAGLELARWKPRARVCALACLWLLLAGMHQNLVFING